MSLNPYASPQTDCSSSDTDDPDVVRRRMLGVIRVYRWMGWIGLVGFGTVFAVSCTSLLLSGHATAADMMVGLCFYAVYLTPFALSLQTAKMLEFRPEGSLPRARLVALILATGWFPFLTVPAILCFRRVTRYHAAWCDLVRAAEDGGSAEETW